jgi:hypothetical protein
MAAKARKLYFDYSFTGAATSQEIKLTPEYATTPGDRFGALLESLPALLGTSQPKSLRQNEITAIAVPSAQSADTSILLQFNGGVNDGSFENNPAPFYANSGTGTTQVAGKAGQSAVFVRNPRVLLTAMTTGGSGTFRGTLIVQRQHSIEV